MVRSRQAAFGSVLRLGTVLRLGGFAWAVGLGLGGAAARGAETYALRHAPASVQDVEVRLEVGGNLKILERGKTVPLKMSTLADLAYEEKPVARPTVGERRSVRHYSRAEAAIRVEQSGSVPKLSAERRLIAVDAPAAGKPVLFSPSGPLTRDELDLLDVPFNSLLAADLLPPNPVRIGETWQLEPKRWAALVGLDAAATAEIPLVLMTVDGDTAVIEGEGQLTGAIGGISTDMGIKFRGTLDLGRKQFTNIVAAIQENRSVGHVGPGLDIVARVKLNFTPKTSTDRLTDKQLAAVPLDPNPAVLMLVQKFPDHSQFLHGRDWYLLNGEDRAVVLRWMKNGELKGQCNVHAMSPAKVGFRPTAENFTTSIKKGLGEQLLALPQVGEAEGRDGIHIHHAVAVGKAAELPIQWNYFLLSDTLGRQMVFTFTLERQHVEEFARLDWETVSTASFVPDEKLASEAEKLRQAEQKPAATAPVKK